MLLIISVKKSIEGACVAELNCNEILAIYLVTSRSFN
jgi:hypothetical protein